MRVNTLVGVGAYGRARLGADMQPKERKFNDLHRGNAIKSFGFWGGGGGIAIQRRWIFRSYHSPDSVRATGSEDAESVQFSQLRISRARATRYTVYKCGSARECLRARGTRHCAMPLR